MHRVRFHPTGRVVEVPGGTTLLEAARRAGLPIARSCGADGLCSRCALVVLSGAEALEPESDAERRTKARNRLPAEWRLACRARVAGDVEVTASYW
jgi:ferredoxin, 2Fe-2S